MEASLLAVLLADGTLAGLVSTRIYWNAIPQDSADPCVVLYRIAGAEGMTHGGPDGLIAATVQIDVRATEVDQMWAVRDAVVARLNGYRDASFGGVFQNSERQDSAPRTGGLYHRASLDFDVRAAA